MVWVAPPRASVPAAPTVRRAVHVHGPGAMLMVPVTESAPFTVSEAAESMNDPATVSGPFMVNDVLGRDARRRRDRHAGERSGARDGLGARAVEDHETASSARRRRSRSSSRRSGSPASPDTVVPENVTLPATSTIPLLTWTSVPPWNCAFPETAIVKLPLIDTANVPDVSRQVSVRRSRCRPRTWRRPRSSRSGRSEARLST